ncbi:MAG: septum formation protein Maf [Clostridiaceae bacterium]|jgi:septum formation protein|nr:septum formation protein Maf [Clostridiaceae bacterium]
MQKTEKLILASKSPRRQELLGMLTQEFTVVTADVDEDGICSKFTGQRDKFADYTSLAGEMVRALAAAKATAVATAVAPLADRVILAADTIVVLDEEVLGKPHDKDEAREMLYKLSGRDHQVFTGVHILAESRSESFHAEAKVRFFPLDDFTRNLIDYYVAGGSSLDKAGGYGIQDEGAFFVHSIDGDFFTVMGLPVAETARRLYKYIPEVLF